MPVKDIKYLVISDIHLGHSKTKSEEIIEHLDVFFHHYQSNTVFAQLDIIFIAGDLFDNLLDFANRDIPYISLWLSRLVVFCSTHDIKLRILFGTPSHDWNQSRIAETLVTMIDKPIDFKYVDTLYIEHMTDLDLTILYVPDEWTPNTDLTFSQVQTLMKEKGLFEVDIAMMHGCFNYQLKGIPGHIQRHEEANYLSIVKYFISIGHFHVFSTYERIIAQGSFDRLAQGEEGPKGGVVIQITKDGDMRFDFIENKLAKIYKTIEFRSYDIDKCTEKLEKFLKKLPYDSYVRIRAAKDHPFYSGLDSLKLKHLDFNFSRISLDKEDRNYQLLNTVEAPADYTPLTITRDNIKTLLLDAVTSKYTLTQPQLELLDDILEKTNS